MSSSYRVLKLQSGEEIIAKIKGKEGEKVILENPMIFTTQLRSTPFGQTQEITFLKDWLINIKKDTVKIPENFIVTWNSPSTDVAKLYDAERKNKSSRDYKKSSTNPNENNRRFMIMDGIDETATNVYFTAQMNSNTANGAHFKSMAFEGNVGGTPTGQPRYTVLPDTTLNGQNAVIDNV